MNTVNTTPTVKLPGALTADTGSSAARLRTILRQNASTDVSPVKDPRVERDTVMLSDGAGKIVNVNRGLELAAEMKSAQPGSDFSSRMKMAMEDIFRIGRLFGETLRSAFARWS